MTATTMERPATLLNRLSEETARVQDVIAAEGDTDVKDAWHIICSALDGVPACADADVEFPRAQGFCHGVYGAESTMLNRLRPQVSIVQDCVGFYYEPRHALNAIIGTMDGVPVCARKDVEFPHVLDHNNPFRPACRNCPDGA